MNQPNFEATSKVSVEGFDEFYQVEAQAGLGQAQSDPVESAALGPEQAQSDPIESEAISPEQAQGDSLQEIHPDPSDGVALEEAAKVLGLHLDTVRKRLQKGKIKGFKVADKYGDKWLVHKDELNKVRPFRPVQNIQAQAEPDLIQAYEVLDEPEQAQRDPGQAQADPVVAIQLMAGQAQASPVQKVQPAPEHERLMNIIESQAHQLKAAGDVIVYLKSELDDTKTNLKLLTDSQHKRGFWSRVSHWFVGSGGNE